MFDNFFNFNPSITKTGSWYLIQGIIYRDLEYDFKATFGTTIIANKILIKQSNSRFKIHQFFMVEFAYLLDNIINTQSVTRQRLYRVNINKYRYLYEEVKNNTWIKTTLNDYSGLYNINNALAGFKFKPFSDQRAFLEYYSNVKYGFQLKGVLLDSKAGTGKANWIGSDILTPSGFVKMGDIKPGDYVIGRNGQPTEVLAVYPQGKKQLYKVTFKDGRAENVCEDHLWSVKYQGQYQTLSTKALMDIVPNEPVYIPLMDGHYDGFYSNDVLPLDPYNYGLHSAGRHEFSNENDVKFLNSTYDNRLTLLKGLMDVGGDVDEKGNIFFRSYIRKRIEYVQHLVRSLGGIAKATYTRDISYLKIEINVPIFTSNKKDYAKLHDTLELELVSIEPSFIDYAQCITVAAEDHLYVCSDFIVTHNTVTSLMWSRMLGEGKTIILVLKHLIDEPWLDHLLPTGRRYCFNTPPKVWVSTSDIDPRKSDAEYFVFYKEQLRKEDWKGISFGSIISSLSSGGKTPLKMIIDESHNYNDIDSQQTQGAVYIGGHPYVTDVLSMSGTPIKSAGRETYPLFCMIDKFFDVEVRKDFLKLYSKNNDALNELLAHRLGRIKFTINSIDGLGDPPAPVPMLVKFPGVEKYTLKNIRSELINYIQERVQYYQKQLPNYIYDFNGYLNAYQETIENDPILVSELDKYRAIVDYFRKQGFNTFADSEKSKYCKEVEAKIEAGLKGESLQYFRHITPAIKYLPLKIKGEALGNVLGRARIDAVKDTIKYLNLAEVVKSGIKKTAIYSTYIDAIDTAVIKLVEEGCHPVKYHSQDKASVNDVIKRLRQPETDCIVTSFDSLSEGQPLLECNQLIMLNLPWREYIIKQTIARIFRKGQDTECFVWAVMLDTEGEDNITTRTQDIVTFFKEQVDIILSGGLGFDTVEGSSLKLTDDTQYDFEELVPFSIPEINFRPNFIKKTFSHIFR